MALISVRNLTKRYGGIVAVNNLSMTVEEGSVMGLIGPNGAGKTTTIKILLGLLRPDSGSVRVFGEDPWDNPEIKFRIGVIYEDAGFPPHHKVLDYLRRTCRIFGISESRALEMLEAVDLQKEAYRRPIRTLSAGMLQKFAIAHALIHKPELVIADEPTSNLDPQARSKLLDLILQLHDEEKVYFLISSHILPELSRVCSSVAIINNGRVWAQGSFMELCEKFGVGATRISTDKPEILAEVLRRLDYVRNVKVNAGSVSVHADPKRRQNLYEAVLKAAEKVNAKILGIESGTASLEELFRLAVDAGGGVND